MKDKKSKWKKVLLLLTKEQDKGLKDIAGSMGVSKTAIIRLAIKRFLDDTK